MPCGGFGRILSGGAQKLSQCVGNAAIGCVPALRVCVPACAALPGMAAEVLGDREPDLHLRILIRGVVLEEALNLHSHSTSCAVPTALLRPER